MIINPYIFGGFDPDAQAFITAAGLTDNTQKTAINQLVVDLKGYGIWSKMKAIYPFVGGTASTHKWNLKDPRDLDAAFRLVFNGGWTHSSTGALPNGTNGYAETKFISSLNLSLNSTHYSAYSRTNTSRQSFLLRANFLSANKDSTLAPRWNDNNSYFRVNSAPDSGINTGSDSTGLFIANRISSAETRNYRNTNRYVIATNSGALSDIQFSFSLIGTVDYDNRELAFGSIGDGLTDTEAANLYTAVQAYQTTLGRSVGPQTVSDPDAQAFVTAADIQDQVQAQAINTLTIDLKNYNIWSKMKAIYPFVGGTASTHKWNLKDPRDLDVAFRLVFNGGWTHSSTGALPNGTNGFADTKLNDSNLIASNCHLSLYSRTNSLSNSYDMGIYNPTLTKGIWFLLRNTGNLFRAGVYQNTSSEINYTNANSNGLYLICKNGSTMSFGYKNGIENVSDIRANSTPTNTTIYISALNNNNTPSFGYSQREIAFSSIGEGFSNIENINLYNIVQAYQVALSRQV